jgi:hypothetical protein
MPDSREIQFAFERDFDLFGLNTVVKEYKLAWCLNQHLCLNLAKSEDLAINFVDDRTIIISNFTFTTTHCTFKLLKNHAISTDEEVYLLPELKNVDYFLMIVNESDTFDIEYYRKKLPEVKILQSFRQISIDKLQNKENLIF